MSTAIESAQRTLTLEADAIRAAADRIDNSFDTAIELLKAADRVIVTGIGKSGAVAQKLASTLTSTGTAASWIHPVESLHGDLGLVTANSVAIMLSKSGETEELFGLVRALSRRGVPIVAITGVADSTLGRAATVFIDGAVAEEACPHNLAPTTSTAVAMALGDALAVALIEAKGFRSEDFAELHPGGALGRRLLLRVEEVAVQAGGSVSSAAPMRDVVVLLAKGRGIVAVVDSNQLVGVITAGDLTRLAGRTEDYLEIPAAEVMTREPQTFSEGTLAAVVLGEMERHGISAAPVLGVDGEIVGIVHLHDLLRAGAG
jgi:arabinose-5-phosphate isomerase